MVSKVIIIFAVCLCVMQATFASTIRVSRQAEDKPAGGSTTNNANAASGTDSFINNISQMFGTMPKNPNDFVTIFANMAQGAPRVERGLIDGASSGSSSSGGDNISNNFSQIFTKFTRNPSDIIIIMTNYFKKGESAS
ncbi:unnamed protein product [Colias eurytheme]|nr:unnamed protein product [Colias eurytheme]